MKGILDEFDPLATRNKSTPKPEESSSKNPEDLIPSEKQSTNVAEKKESSKAKTKSKSSSKPNDQQQDAPMNEKQPSSSSTPKDPSAPPPFDFQRFLDLLRHKSADPIARYLKSFLQEFNKRVWTADEQVKIITDFEHFIAGKMDQHPPFSTLSDAEMDNAMEGMEKLIMNRLYTKTFSPEIPPNKRTDSHEEDVIRDTVLDDKMSLWKWIEGRHLDIPNKFLRNGEAFVKLASDELRKINHYRAPRDKVVCILNCCKVIFGLLRQSSSEENADGFLPILIYVVIKAHPKNMISNMNYIQRFRRPEKLNGEAGYYLSSLQGAVSFIETLDHQSLSISDEEFNKNMDAAISEQKKQKEQQEQERLAQESSQPPITPIRGLTPEPGARTGTGSPRTASGNLTPSAVLQSSAGLLAAPLKSISKLFDQTASNTRSNDSSNSGSPVISGQTRTFESQDYAARQEQLSSRKNNDKEDKELMDALYKSLDNGNNANSNAPKLSPEELAARQISAEEEEARRISQQEFESVVETLSQMFPTLDRNVIVDVATEKQGRVGAAVDSCLALVST